MKIFMSYLMLATLVTFASSAKAQTETTVVCKVQNQTQAREFVVEITIPGAKVPEAFKAAVKSKSALGVKVNILDFRQGEFLMSVSYFGFEPDMYKAVGAAPFGVLELTYDFWSAQRLVLEYRVDSDIYQGSCKLK